MGAWHVQERLARDVLDRLAKRCQTLAHGIRRGWLWLRYSGGLEACKACVAVQVRLWEGCWSRWLWRNRHRMLLCGGRYEQLAEERPRRSNFGGVDESLETLQALCAVLAHRLSSEDVLQAFGRLRKDLGAAGSPCVVYA